ncbi:MAG: ATP-dependent RecD-like DNA helicase [Marinobacter sp.]|jgi:exodeoxyribonuclease V alpha subunit|nr:ATP-dependent RecD-like DNA helicase [Marinobacter sp.]MCL1484259.1 ATP-dependent RecD-like DNA helicase [Marinobacter sp.]
MTNVRISLIITDISSRGRNGGAIVSGITENGRRYGVVLGYQLLSDSALIDQGQEWEVQGKEETWRGRVRGRLVERLQIQATKARLVNPAGQNIIHWISRSPDCAGLGLVKARALWNSFGAALPALIENWDVDALSTVLTPESAQTLCNAFEKQKTLRSLVWLDQIGIPQRVGIKAAQFYGDHLESEIARNPYCLLAFEGKWRVIDSFALERLGIAPSDPRRLEAAIEEQLYRGLTQGHTCLPKTILLQGTRRMLNEDLSPSLKSPNHRWVKIEDTYQASGPFAIERFIANRLITMAAGETNLAQESLFSPPEYNRTRVEHSLEQFQSEHGFELTTEQKSAILTSTSSCLSLILGGAGCGKTTVLKALYFSLEKLNSEVSIFQVALAGRAAQRMAEATGRSASTIASLLANTPPEAVPANSIVVCDEMSMVDILLFYRLLRWLPSGSRLILVGDPAQLPPIGPGLVLHVLQGHPQISQTTLTVTKRQSESSGIPSVTHKIRHHQIPDFTDYTGVGSGVSFVQCEISELNQTLWQVYKAIGGTADDYSVQILCPTKGGPGGTHQINQIWHDGYRNEAKKVRCFDLYGNHGVVPAATMQSVTLQVGDLVMFTENNHELGLRNGSLGKIIAALEVRNALSECCIVEWDDGRQLPLISSHVYALTHAYGLTIHKAQGSQFNRVIIPIRQSRLLDQSLVYTAATRGVDQVVFVGDMAATKTAIQKPSSGNKRHVGLRRLLQPSDEAEVR